MPRFDFSFPPKNQLTHCRAKSCRLTNSKPNPDLEGNPFLSCRISSVLWPGGAAIFWGAGAVLAGSSQDRFVSPLSFVQPSPSFVSPEDLECVLFSAFLGRGTKPHPQQPLAPSGGGSGVEVLMCWIKPSRWESPFVDEAHLNTSSP